MSDTEEPTQPVVASKSPERKKSVSRSKSPTRGSKSRSASPKRSRSRSRSAKRSRSRSPKRSRSRSPKRSRSDSRSRSPRRSRSRSRSYRRSRSRSPRARGAIESNKVYIGNLNFRTSERDLRHHFDRFGRIQDIYVPRDRDGSSRGFGFITFEDERDAEDAAKELDEREFDGRMLRVNIARKRKPLGSDDYDRDRRGGSSYGGSYGGGGGGRSSYTEICRDNQRGMCSRGSSCRFSHGGYSRSRSRSRSRSYRRRSRSRSRSRSRGRR